MGSHERCLCNRDRFIWVRQDMDGLVADLPRNMCSRALRDDGLLPSPSRVESHYRFTRLTLPLSWEFRLQYVYFHSDPYEPILRTAFAPLPLPLLTSW